MSTIIIGDIAEGTKWWGTVNFMKERFAEQYAHINPSMNEWRFLSDTVKVFLKLVDGRPQAFIYTSGGLYLESGFISVGGTTEGTLDDQPATLLTNTDMVPYLSSTETPIELDISLGAKAGVDLPFGGKPVISGQLSKALAGDLTISEKRALLMIRKLTQQNLQASMFTGKLQLFVQSIYGSKRTDYVIAGDGTDLNLTGESSAFTLKSYGLSSTWLLTTTDYRYFLCTKLDNQLLVTPLNPQGEGTKFRDALLTHANRGDFEFSNRIEACILSTALPDNSAAQLVSITGPAIVGQPLAYGWKAEWDGMASHIVTINVNTTVRCFESNQYKIDVNHSIADDGSDAFSASCMQVGTANDQFCLLSSKVNLFYYNKTTAMMERVDSPPTDLYNPLALFAFDAPVYCYTVPPVNGGQELVVLHAYYDITYRVGEYYEYTPERVNSLGYQLLLATKLYNGDNGTLGFYFTGATVDDMRVNWDSFASSTEVYGSLVSLNNDWTTAHYTTYPYDNNNGWIEEAGWASYGSLPLYRKDVGGGAYHYADRTYESATIQYEQYDDSSQWKHVASFAEAPHGSCNSVIVGISESSNRVHIQVGHYQGKWYWQDALIGKDPITNQYGTWYAGAVMEKFPGDIHVRHWMEPGYPGLFHEYAGNEYYTNPPNLGVQYSTKYYNFVNGETYTEGLETIADGDPRYFYPDQDEVQLNVVDHVYNSISHGSLVYHTLYTTENGFLRDSSVGWV